MFSRRKSICGSAFVFGAKMQSRMVACHGALEYAPMNGESFAESCGEVK